MGLDPARDDALRQLAGVVLQRLDAAGLQRVDVVVVDLGRLREDLLVGHHLQQLGLADAPRPLLAQLRALVAQVGDQLLEQRSASPAGRSCSPAVRPSPSSRWVSLSCSDRLVVHLLLLVSGSAVGHRGAGRERGPRRGRGPVIVAVMSSRPSDGVEVSTPTIRPISDSVRRALEMSCADLLVGLAALEELAQRPRERALEALRIRALALTRHDDEGVAHADQGAHRPGDALLRVHAVEPGRGQSRVDVGRRRLRRARPAGYRGSGSSGRRWRAPRRRPRRRRSCSPAPRRSRSGARRRRGSRRRRAAAAAVVEMARTSVSRQYATNSLDETLMSRLESKIVIRPGGRRCRCRNTRGRVCGRCRPTPRG